MAELNFYKGTKAKYSSANLSNNSLYFTEDTKEMFLGSSKLNYTLEGYVNDNTLHLPLATSDTIIQAFAKIEHEASVLTQEVSDLTDRVTVLEEIHDIAVYTITKNATNAIIANNRLTISQGDSYYSTVVANEGYVLDRVVVTMNGLDVSSSVYSNGLIQIENVTGNIVITVYTTEIAIYTITYNLTNCSVNNTISSVQSGDDLRIVLTPIEDYYFAENSITVITSEGEDITHDVVIANQIVILNVSSNIVITANATLAPTYTISYYLSNCNSNNEITSIKGGSVYQAVISPNEFYTIGEIIVTMGGNNIEVINGVINILNVTGNIIITANATMVTYDVTYILTNTESSNSSNKVAEGSTFTTTLSYDEVNYNNLTVKINMNGIVLVDAYDKLTRTITIENVNGNIIIEATALRKEIHSMETYSLSMLNDLPVGESKEVILANPTKNNGYVLGYDGSSTVSQGNGFSDKIEIEQTVADLVADSDYKMIITKYQDTKEEDIFEDKFKQFTVTGALNGTNFERAQTSIEGYDLYKTNNVSVRYNSNVTGNLSINFNGNVLPRTVYVKMYISNTSDSSSGSMNTTDQEFIATANNTVTSLSNFSAVTMNSNGLSMSITARNGGNLFSGSRTFACYVLVPNNIFESEKVGTQTVLVGNPYFSIVSTRGAKTPNGTTSNVTWSTNNMHFELISPESLTSTSMLSLGVRKPLSDSLIQIKNESNYYLNASTSVTDLKYSNVLDETSVWHIYDISSRLLMPNLVNINDTSKDKTKYTMSNTAVTVAYGSSYVNVLTLNENVLLESVKITMRGKDVSDMYFDYDTNTISIDVVDGDIVINVFALFNTMDDKAKITYEFIDVASLTNKVNVLKSFSTSDYDVVLKGDLYSAEPSFEGLTTLSSFNGGITLTNDDKMDVIKVIVTMNDLDYVNDFYDFESNKLTIPIVQGDVHIKVYGGKIIGYVEEQLYDDLSDNHIIVENKYLPNGTYNVSFFKDGQEMTDYNNITTFNI